MTLWYPTKHIAPAISWERYTRNGQLVQAELPRRVAAMQHHLLAFRKKCVFSYSVDPRNISGGASGSVTRWRWYHHTSYGCTNMTAFVQLAAASSASGTDPSVYCQYTPSGGSTSSTERIHYGRTDGVGTELPSNFSWWAKISWDVSENTAYDCALVAADYARPISIMVFETSQPALDDTAVSHVADHSRYELGQPIVDADVQELLQAQTGMIDRNLTQLCWWSKDVNSYNQGTATPSWTNVLDGSTTVDKTGSGYTVGWRVDLSNLATRGRSTAPCRFAARFRTVGSGTSQVRLRTESATLASLSTSSTSFSWQTTDVDLDAAVHQFDFQALDPSGELNGIDVDAMSLYVLEA